MESASPVLLHPEQFTLMDLLFFLVTADLPLSILWHARRRHRDDSDEPMYVSIGVRTAMYLLCTWCFVMGDLLLLFLVPFFVQAPDCTFSEASRHNDAHHADTEPSTFPTQWAVRKLARVRK